MNRLISLMLALTVAAALGCGEDEPEGLPNASPGDLSAERVDWVVHGMYCEGEEVLRMVGTVDENDEAYETRYMRGDECVDEGDPFWDEIPEIDGDDVTVTVGDGEQSDFTAELADDDAIRLVERDGDDELLMRRVYPGTNPTPNPELSDIDLAGEWWMEGYPCHEEEVPQVVRIIDSAGADLHFSKVLGDECIGDGESFIDATRDGTSLSGEAEFTESGDFNDFDFGDDDENGEAEVPTEVTGTVHREDFMRLTVLETQAVNLRRVVADGPE